MSRALLMTEVKDLESMVTGLADDLVLAQALQSLSRSQLLGLADSRRVPGASQPSQYRLPKVRATPTSSSRTDKLAYKNLEPVNPVIRPRDQTHQGPLHASSYEGPPDSKPGDHARVKWHQRDEMGHTKVPYKQHIESSMRDLVSLPEIANNIEDPPRLLGSEYGCPLSSQVVQTREGTHKAHCKQEVPNPGADEADTDIGTTFDAAETVLGKDNLDDDFGGGDTGGDFNGSATGDGDWWSPISRST
ncbi:uncharacterized protein JN550_006960 [Neoarthrinium moseri]|uniref:uncharacterized protein n=1 Tax=Neoarthrinium moseri TaxID=1658444 RepID=UPI001FDCA14C|nr:uncharacterized protein JN550_006960 [Neoarthrinium moseri]KAI1867819.1 hypothetical protein JN550_006960 [Neoarthrinium moseri]